MSVYIKNEQVCLHMYIIYMYIYMAAPQKHRACNRPGRPFCDKACDKIGGLATNPPCDKPAEDYSTLHRGPRQRFVREGPRQRFVTEGGRDNPYFEALPYIHMYTCMCTYRYGSLGVWVSSRFGFGPPLPRGGPATAALLRQGPLAAGAGSLTSLACC